MAREFADMTGERSVEEEHERREQRDDVERVQHRRRGMPQERTAVSTVALGEH